MNLTAFALSVASDTKYKMFSLDAWLKALEVALFGMAMVFLVLAILWGVLALFKILFAKDEKKPQKAEAVEEAPVAKVLEDDTRLVAVLTAAISAYREAEEGISPEVGFRVVSFKRAEKARSWNFGKKN